MAAVVRWQVFRVGSACGTRNERLLDPWSDEYPGDHPFRLMTANLDEYSGS